MQEDLRWASHWVPTHLRTQARVVGPVSAAKVIMKEWATGHWSLALTLSFRFLTQWRSSLIFSSYLPFQEWGFHCRTQDPVPTSLGTSPSWRRNTRNLSLTCPERGLEQRWACRGGRWSLHQPHHEHLQPAALQEPHLVAQAELHEAWGKQEAVLYPPPPQLPDSIKKKRASFEKLRKHKSPRVQGKSHLKMWLIVDEKKILNSEWVTHNF